LFIETIYEHYKNPILDNLMQVMLDPRAFLMNPLLYDPATLALLQNPPTMQTNGGGKILGSSSNSGILPTSSAHSHSFRILDLLEPVVSSPFSSENANSANSLNNSLGISGTSAASSSTAGSDKANSSGENGKLWSYYTMGGGALK
jgi:hypothetical protein